MLSARRKDLVKKEKPMNRRVQEARKAYSVFTERELLRLRGAIAVSEFVEESGDGSETI